MPKPTAMMESASAPVEAHHSSSISAMPRYISASERIRPK